MFYRKTAFKLLTVDTFWLSYVSTATVESYRDLSRRNDPFEPSKYPGAGSLRICTATRFSSIVTFVSDGMLSSDHDVLCGHFFLMRLSIGTFGVQL